MKCPTVNVPSCSRQPTAAYDEMNIIKKTNTFWFSEGMHVIHMFFIEREFGEGELLLNHWGKTVHCYLGELSLLSKIEAPKADHKMTKKMTLLSRICWCWLHFDCQCFFLHNFSIQEKAGAPERIGTLNLFVLLNFIH